MLEREDLWDPQEMGAGVGLAGKAATGVLLVSWG